MRRPRRLVLRVVIAYFVFAAVFLAGERMAMRASQLKDPALRARGEIVMRVGIGAASAIVLEYVCAYAWWWARSRQKVDEERPS